MNLLMWIAVSETLPVTTLSQLVHNQPTPSKALLADIEVLCATKWVGWVDREEVTLPTLRWCTESLSTTAKVLRTTANTTTKEPYRKPVTYMIDDEVGTLMEPFGGE